MDVTNSVLAVAVTGKIGAGKTTLTRALAERFRLRRVSFGELVTRQAVLRSVSTGRKSLQDVGQRLMADLGPKGMLEAAIEAANARTAPALVIDGVRHVDVYRALTERSAETILVFLDVNERERRVRWMLREASRSSTRASFDEVSRHPVEQEIDSLKEFADVVVDSYVGCESAVSVVAAYLAQRGLVEGTC